LRQNWRIIDHGYFKDYAQNEVKLATDAWSHIQEKHPEITKEIIAKTLSDPDAVILSTAREDVEMYYQLRTKKNNKLRYLSLVVVKKVKKELWVSTSMTKDNISKGLSKNNCSFLR